VRFSLINLDDEDRSDEVFVVVPDGPKAVIAVPLRALPLFLPLLARAWPDLPEPCCAACGGNLLGPG